MKIEWALWPWAQCKAVTTSAPEHHRFRCERKKKHPGPHVHEYGMYNVCWFDGTYIVTGI